jgi:hypothetical protein
MSFGIECELTAEGEHLITVSNSILMALVCSGTLGE